ncbi:MAG: DUF3347 domain-containing protein [Ignavibacteria bacterium]|nr:DUF3347 domain-containing protein [Ignavibacteria bacterium]
MFHKCKSTLIFPFSLYSLLSVVIIFGGCAKQEKDPNYDKAVTEANQKRTADSLLNAQKENVQTKQDSLFDNVKIVAADSTAQSSAAKKEMTDELRKKIRSNMNKVFSVYLDIKDELVDNDSVDAKKEAQELISTIMKAQTDVGEDNVGKKWRLSSEKIKTISDKIQSATTLSAQRTLFNTLTESMFEAIKEYGLDGKTVYQLSCASANSNKGGMWLEDSKDADNPYAGKSSKEIDTRACVKITGAWKYE